MTEGDFFSYQKWLTIPSMAVSLMFLSVGFSKVISGKIFELRMTRRTPAVRMMTRELLPSSDRSDFTRRSFNRNWPRPRSCQDDLSLSKM